MLPLKNGVADIALQYARATDGRAVPIVPCGLTYFNGHQFRARAVLEFGPPFSVSEEQIALYTAQHAAATAATAAGAAPSREVAAIFMREVEQRLRSVLVTAPDYEVCPCSRRTVCVRCTCGAYAVHTRCTRGAHAVHMRCTCTCGVRAVRM